MVPRLPSLRAITFEIVPDHLEHGANTRPQIRSMLEDLHRVWDRRRPAPAAVGGAPFFVTAPDDVDAVAAAEADLASSVVRVADPGDDHDPGVGVMRELVAAIRRGLSITVLPLTLRLLRFELGREAVDEAFAACWAASSPERHADAEARNLAAVLRGRFGHVAHLTEVLDYELALVDLAREGKESAVEFTCDPGLLLDALREGRRPTSIPRAELTVSPGPRT